MNSVAPSPCETQPYTKTSVGVLGRLIYREGEAYMREKAYMRGHFNGTKKKLFQNDEIKRI